MPFGFWGIDTCQGGGVPRTGRIPYTAISVSIRSAFKQSLRPIDMWKSALTCSFTIVIPSTLILSHVSCQNRLCIPQESFIRFSSMLGVKYNMTPDCHGVAVTPFYGSWERLTPRSFCLALGLYNQRENTWSSPLQNETFKEKEVGLQSAIEIAHKPSFYLPLLQSRKSCIFRWPAFVFYTNFRSWH